MAIRVLFQGVTRDNHLAAVRQVLGIPNPERIIVSVAFMSEGGLSLLNDALTPVELKRDSRGNDPQAWAICSIVFRKS